MKKRVFQERVRIVANRKLNREYFHLKLSSPNIARTASPGQFVEIKVLGHDALLLRRPLSIHKTDLDSFSCLVKIVGQATQFLSQKKPGEYLDIIGPLGNGFDCSQLLIPPTRILVAGGIGVAPLVFLMEKITRLQNDRISGGQTASKVRNLVLIGAKAKDEILCENEFKKLGCSVKIATDNGSAGFRGKVTELLDKILQDTQGRAQATIYACGPRPMLKRISDISHKYKINAQISLEEHMACGIGACLGCVVETLKGLRRVCKEGPVFKADEVVW